jgi:hypothetical protein
VRTLSAWSLYTVVTVIVLTAALACQRNGPSIEISVTVRANACYTDSNSCYVIRVPLADVDVQGPDGYHFTSTTDETGEIVVRLPRSGAYTVRIDSGLIAEGTLIDTVQVYTGQHVEVPLEGTVTVGAPSQ